MDTKMLQFHETFQQSFAKLMPSKGNTIKYHRLAHAADTIRRYGCTKHISAQFYEALNKWEKLHYKATSRRNRNYQ